MKEIVSVLHATESIKIPFAIFLVWLINLSGMTGIYLGYEDWFLPKTPFNLTTNFLLLLWVFPVKSLRHFLIWFTTFLVGMAVEIAGVQTGVLFGAYHYGDNLGIKAWGVPLLIGINWSILTFITAVISRKIFPGYLPAALFGAFLMVALDFLIEPTAPLFDFWHWEAGDAPLQNYITWFLVALILQIFVRKQIGLQDSRLPFHMFASQFVFFAFFYGVYQL